MTPGAELDVRLGFAMIVRAAGDDEVELARDGEVAGGGGRMMVGVEDLEPLQSGAFEASENRRFLGGSAETQANRMRDDRDATRREDLIHCLLNGGLLHGDEGGGVIAEVELEGLVNRGDVALVAQ